MHRKLSTKSSRENPAWTSATFAKSRPAAEVLRKVFNAKTAETLLKPRGRPKSANPKVAVSLRMPPDTLARWRATGPGWQTRMVQALDRAARSFAK